MLRNDFCIPFQLDFTPKSNIYFTCSSTDSPCERKSNTIMRNVRKVVRKIMDTRTSLFLEIKSFSIRIHLNAMNRSHDENEVKSPNK